MTDREAFWLLAFAGTIIVVCACLLTVLCWRAAGYWVIRVWRGRRVRRVGRFGNTPHRL